MRVLLVSPEFRGYWRSYASALEDLGHDVDIFLYDNFRTAGIFVVDKLANRLPERLAPPVRALTLTRRLTRNAIAFLDSVNVDAVLVIKGDLLEHEFWDAIDRRRIPSVLYLYDELHGMQHTADTLRRPGHLATYSPRDQSQLAAEGYSVTYVPQFFDPKLAFEPVIDDAIVFVGARFPHREALLVDLHNRGIPVAAYGLYWSHSPVDRLRTLQLKRPPIPGRPNLTLQSPTGWLPVLQRLSISTPSSMGSTPGRSRSADQEAYSYPIGLTSTASTTLAPSYWSTGPQRARRACSACTQRSQLGQEDPRGRPQTHHRRAHLPASGSRACCSLVEEQSPARSTISERRK